MANLISQSYTYPFPVEIEGLRVGLKILDTSTMVIKSHSYSFQNIIFICGKLHFIK